MNESVEVLHECEVCGAPVSDDRRAEHDYNIHGVASAEKVEAVRYAFTRYANNYNDAKSDRGSDCHALAKFALYNASLIERALDELYGKMRSAPESGVSPALARKESIAE
jgi:hypothetical protein